MRQFHRVLQAIRNIFSPILQLHIMCLWQFLFWWWVEFATMAVLPSAFQWNYRPRRDKLWPKCQFQFHLQCIFLNWWLSWYIWFTNIPKQKAKHFFLYLFSLTAFSLLKQHKSSAISFYNLMKWIKTFQRDNTFTTSKGNNLIFSELIRLRRVAHSNVWLRHGCESKKPRLLVKQQTFFLYLREWFKTFAPF